MRRQAAQPRLDTKNLRPSVANSQTVLTISDHPYLLRDCGQNPLLEAIKLVKTTPRPDLRRRVCTTATELQTRAYAYFTEADKNASHGLQVKFLVAVENHDKPAQSGTERLNAKAFSDHEQHDPRSNRP